MAVDWDWTRVVFDHVKLTVDDAAASVAFYKTVLATLEIPPLWERADGAQFANLVVSEDEPGGPIHIAFVAASREQVDALHRAGIDAGFRDNGAPGVREQYSSPRRAASTLRSWSIPTATTSKRCAARSSRSSRAPARRRRPARPGARARRHRRRADAAAALTARARAHRRAAAGATRAARARRPA